MFAPAAGAAPVRAGRAGDMEKGPFSVEWLAQSSLGGAREMPGESRPCPLGLPAQRRARRFGSPRAGQGRHSVTARGAPREGSPDGSPLQSPPSVPAESPPEREPRSPEHAAVPAPGRARTKFSAAQLQELERSFGQQRYIGAGEKRRLAAVLNLSQSQVSAASPSARAGHGAGRHLTVTGDRAGTGTGTRIGTAPAGAAARQPHAAGSKWGWSKLRALPAVPAAAPSAQDKVRNENVECKFKS